MRGDFKKSFRKNIQIFSMNIFERKNAELLTEFDRYVVVHPQIADAIPNDALVAMEVEDDTDFNQWSQQMARTQVEPGQQIVFIRIKKLRPVQSRIEELAIASNCWRCDANRQTPH